MLPKYSAGTPSSFFFSMEYYSVLVMMLAPAHYRVGIATTEYSVQSTLCTRAAKGVASQPR